MRVIAYLAVALAATALRGPADAASETGDTNAQLVELKETEELARAAFFEAYRSNGRIWRLTPLLKECKLSALMELITPKDTSFGDKMVDVVERKAVGKFANVGPRQLVTAVTMANGHKLGFLMGYHEGIKLAFADAAFKKELCDLAVKQAGELLKDPLPGEKSK